MSVFVISSAHSIPLDARLQAHRCALCILKSWTAKARDTLRILHVDVSPVTGVVLWKGAYLPFGSGAVWLSTMTLFSEPASEVHFTGEESGMQWEDYLFELQNTVVWRMF